jgi:hypothetical protein
VSYDPQLLLTLVPKVRRAFALLKDGAPDEVAAALERVDAALAELGRSAQIVADNNLHTTPGEAGEGSVQIVSGSNPLITPEVRAWAAACDARREDIRAARAAFIRTRRHMLAPDPCHRRAVEAVTFDVVRSVRENGRPVQRHCLTLGTWRRAAASPADRYRRCEFVLKAGRALLEVGFRPELEHKLLVELIRKAAITDEDVQELHRFPDRRPDDPALIDKLAAVLAATERTAA